MVAKMIILALCVVAAMSSAVLPAAKYPAGVNPLVCPNYPYCDNVALALNSAGWSGWAGARTAWDVPAWTGYGGWAGAPYGVWAGARHGVWAGVPVAARYPAGVDPNTCPNYPYCH